MTSASLLLIAVLGQAPEVDPRALVPRLGAPRYAEREEAAAALERLGGKALPALRAARDLRDPEVQSRAVALVNKIEGALLTQPTMLSLDFTDKPLLEAVKDLGEQSGTSITLVPDQSPQWATRRVTVHEPSPLPFWQAMDRFCDAARLQYNYGMYGMPQARQPSLPLFDGNGRPAVPTVDSGPFRVSVLALHYQRDVTFPAGVPRFVGPGQLVGPRFNTTLSENFYAQMQVVGEPRLAVSQTGPLRIEEAVDDRGQGLVSDLARAAANQRTSGYFGVNAGPVVQVQAALTRPEQPGKTIRKLRGILPLTVTTRKPGPLTIKLEGAAGQTFRNEDVAVTVADVRPLGNTRQTSIEMSVRPLSGSAGGPGGGRADVAMHRPDSLQQTIELSDAQGRLVPWYQTSYDLESGRVTLAVTPQALDGNAAPVEMRFYSLARASTEVAFEFNDLPLP